MNTTEGNKLIAKFMEVTNEISDLYYLPQFGHYFNSYDNIEFNETFSYPGRSVDDYDEYDYKEMSMGDLRDIVARVQEFDKLCDAIVAETIYMAENGEVFEEEYTEIKTRKVFDVH